MQTFLLTVLFVGALMTAMAVGVIFSNRHLKGSCGGKGGPECACDAQGIPRRCETKGGADHDPTPRDVVPLAAFGRRRS
jgi:hypothetical protein